MITNIILTESIISFMGIFFIPIAMREIHEPLFSLWLDFAENHINNDFDYISSSSYGDADHPDGWFNIEFEKWLDEIGYPVYTHEGHISYMKLMNYLRKHHYIESKIYWNHYIYRINAKKVY